jgi:Ala-tRNA(Pro) deacylase
VVTTIGHEVAPFDVIEVTGRRVGDVTRTGEIVEVLGAPERPHYRVHWDDGHESVFFPGAGTSVRHGAGSRRHDTPPTCDEVIDALTAANVPFELLPHRRTTSASGSALALGVLPQKTGKTVVVRLRDEFVRAVVPASRRLSLDKLGHLLGAAPEVASQEELDGLYPQFQLGAVPPFGGPGDRVVVDRRLAEAGNLILETGCHELSLRMASVDLVEVAHAEVADIAVG